MAKTRKLSRTLLIQITVITASSIVLLGCLWISQQFSQFRMEAEDIRSAQLAEKQAELVRQVEDTIRFIHFKRSQVEDRVKSTLRQRVNEAHALASHIYEMYRFLIGPDEIRSLVVEILRPIRFNDGRGYYFATSLEGVEKLFADRPEMESLNLIDIRDDAGAYVIRDMIDMVNRQDEGFCAYTWTRPDEPGRTFRKLSYIKRFEPFDWFIGTGEYLDDTEERIRHEVLEWVEKIRFGKDGYVFAGTWDGLSLTEPAKGRNMIETTDPNGVRIVRELIRLAKQGGGFVQYVMPKIDESRPLPKLAYTEGIPEWRWYVGAGMYIDDIEKSIAEAGAGLKAKVIGDVYRILLILLGLLVVAYGFTRLTVNRISDAFSAFSRFFEKAATKAVEVDSNRLNFQEFERLADAANLMLRMRIRIQEDLKASEKRLRSVLENMQMLAVILESEGRVAFCNGYLLSLTGWGAEQVLHKNWFELFIVEEDRDRIREIFANTMKRGEFPVYYENPILTRSGEKRLIGWNNTALRDARGRVVAVASIGQDITERKKAEEDLRRSEDRYRTLFEDAIDGIILSDAETGKVIDCNKAAAELLERPKSDLLGSLHEALFPADDLPAEFQDMLKGRPGRIFSRPVETRVKTGSGKTRDVAAKADFINLSNRTVLQSILRDVTERKQAEKEARDLETRLIQAQKMEAIGTLAGGIAHDFNNILFSIIGFSELSLEEAAPGPRLQANLNEVLIAANRARDLVKQILTFSRQTEQELKPVQVGTIAREVMKLLRSTLPSNIAIQTDLQCDVLTLGDPTAIHQIFMNLCTNAAYAMEEKGGVLTVQVNETTLDEAFIRRFPDLAPGAYVRVTVKDTGHGMRPEIRESIFDPYFTTKPKGEGTGLGLALVHGIVKGLHGAVTVESEVGSGSTFTIYLPKLSRPVEANPVSGDALPAGTERIMVVDDEPQLAWMAMQMLQHLGYEVTAKNSSLDALETFRSDPHGFDLVVTDMTMPVMTGDRMAREMMKIRPDLPVILCTGYSRMISNETVSQIGIKGLLMKPFGMKDLAKAIRQILDDRRDGHASMTA